MTAKATKGSGKGKSLVVISELPEGNTAETRKLDSASGAQSDREDQKDESDKKSKESMEKPVGAAAPLDTAFVKTQAVLGAQSYRGIRGSDLSCLGGNAHAEKVFREMLSREKAVAGEWVCFYHSYNSSALIYEVQAAVAKVLFRFGAKHGVLPRLLKKPFEKLSCAADVLTAFPSWPDQDHNPAFKSVGICCSTSLLSPDPEATPSHVFLHGYGASVVTIAVVEKLLRECGTPGRHVKDLAQKVMSLAKDYGLPQALGTGKQGHLLQILIHRSCVDHWAYASLPFGVLDKSRQPLSKSLAKDGVIYGQARLIVNPSAFMRARSVRLYACSADSTFHWNRRKFQEALFDALSPILGSADVRQSAAKGIYGGQLPSWWKDLKTEEDEAAAGTSIIGEASVDSSATAPKMTDITAKAVNTDISVLAAPRLKCRYGGDCRRKNEEHLKTYSHPGDLDWCKDSANVEKAETARSGCDVEVDEKTCAPLPVTTIPRRACCRYGASCYRKSEEHRKAFAHPGDEDWTDTSDANAFNNESIDSTGYS